MSINVLAFMKTEREKFVNEDFYGEQNIFALVGSGAFRFRLEDGEEQEVFPLEAVCFGKHQSYHRYVTSPATLYLFRYKSDEASLPTDRKIVFRDKERIRSTIALLDRLDKSILVDEPTYKASLFLDIVNQYRIENAIPSQKQTGGDDAIISATKYMQRHFRESIALPDVAAQTGLSYVQFARRFRAATGVTPFEYIAALRVKKAKQLLIDTNLSLRAISAECGFNSEYYFSNFFKKHCQMSPTAFRQSLL